MDITTISGHRCASIAIENALHHLNGQLQIKKLDILDYGRSHHGRLVYRLYILIIKIVPWFWEYLYDNQNVMRVIAKLRLLIHQFTYKKVAKIFSQFRPDVVICTQAFPCRLVADYKRKYNLKLPLIAILTDYAPHCYWLDDAVDMYITPGQGVKKVLRERGIAEKRLEVLGIPVDLKFRKTHNRQECLRRFNLMADTPVILIMGGGQGLGPIKKIVRTLDKTRFAVQLFVICGTNTKLYNWLNKNKSTFIKTMVAVGYTKEVDQIMAIASFVVTKAGGMTTAEALCKSLPIIIISPLPGQEMYNTKFLLGTKAALTVNSFDELRLLADELLTNPEKLDNLRKNAARFANPDSAFKIAKQILNTID